MPGRLVLDEPVRAGSDDLVDLIRPGGLSDLARVDDRRSLGQAVDQRSRRLLQGQDHGVRVLGLDAHDVRPEDPAQGGDPSPPFQRGDGVCRSHLLAVVKLHALSERDDVAQAAVTDRVRLGQVRHGCPAAVVSEQRLVHVPHDLVRERRRRRLKIERRRLADAGDLEHSAHPRLLLGLDVRGGNQQSEDGGETEGLSHRESSVTA